MKIDVQTIYRSQPEFSPQFSWQPANLPAINFRYANSHPTALLRWGLTTFGDDIVMSTGFGLSGIVLMHMVSQLRPKMTVFYLQTDLLFPETMKLRDELADRLGIAFTEVHSGVPLIEQNAKHGRDLWRTNPDQCCQLRKVEPLRRFLAGKRAWITGIRRDQSATRANTQHVGWDYRHELLKICPVAAWSREQVSDYIHAHNLPYNSLHDDGYPSIGCMPCTRAVAPGESVRAGRWAGAVKTECGIHLQPDSANGRQRAPIALS